MIGQFQRIGDTVFPDADPAIPCGIYEWRGTIADEIGEFSIRFVVPEDAEQLRQYFVEPVVEAWAKKDKKKSDASDAFLARACEVGYEIVAHLNNHGPDQRQAYRLAAWLFRNRNVGHMTVAREFNIAADFVDLSRPTSPVILLPGLGVNQTQRQHGGREARGTARQVLGEAVADLRARMAAQREKVPEVKLNFSGMLDLFDWLLSRGGGSPTTTSAPLIFIDGHEPQFILPLLGAADSHADFGRIEGTVADCLVYGPTEFAQNLDVLAAHPDEREYLVRQLSQKLLEEGATPEKLDAWLTRVKGDGYLQLIRGGRQLPDEGREEARELASQMMAAMTWCAYRMTGYCYGALMEVVAEDLEQHEPRLTELEGLVFRLDHCQTDLLAGLPLDFLGRAQYRWIIDTWHDVLAATVERFDTGGGDGAAGAVLSAAARLELFAYLLRQRRDADRVTKRKPVQSIEPMLEKRPRNEFEDDYIRRKGAVRSTHPKEIPDDKAEPADADAARDDTGSIIRLTSKFCPACGGEIQLEEIIDAADVTQARFWGFCGGCDTLKVYAANLDELNRTR